MTLNWNNATNADAGYEYRYSSYSSGLSLTDLDPEYTCPTAPPGAPAECKWLGATTSAGATSETITGLTVGTTYFFQVRSKHADHDGKGIEYSGHSNPATAIQRATPAAIDDLAAEPGNGEVTLTWTHLADYDIVNYQIRQDDGSGWGSWTDPTIVLPEGEGTVTYTVSGLVNGTEYSFLVRGHNFKGDGPDGAFVTVTPSGPPAAPRDLTAQESSTLGTQVKLTWADPEDSNIDEYQYRVRVNGGSVWDPDWTLVPDSGADTTTFTVESLKSGGGGYEFQVRALDTDRIEGDRAGAHSSVTGTPTTSETAPEAMTNVQHTVTGVSDGAGGTVTFTWDNPGDASIDNYEYRYKCHNAGSSCGNAFTTEAWNDVAGNGYTTPSGGHQFKLTIFGSAAIVYFQFRAVNDGADDSSTTDVNEGAGPATPIAISRSNTPSSTITTPGAPAGLTVTAAWSDPNWNVTLSWTGFAAAADTIIDKYQYQLSVNGGDYTAWADISGSDATTNTHPFTGVAGTVLVFKLRGVDTGADPDVDGVPATSNQVTLGTPNAPTALNPTDSGGFSGSADGIEFDWTEETDVDGVTVTAYQYRYRVEADDSWGDWADTTYAASSGGVLPPSTHPGLEGSTKYDFQVRAMAGTIPSGPSNIASGFTKGAEYVPGAPTGVMAEAGIGLVTITWTAPAVDEENTVDADRRSAAEFYRYQVTTTDPSSVATAFDSSAEVRIPVDDSPTSHTVLGLTAGTYYFRVHAENIRGEGDWSDSASATPRAPDDGTWAYGTSVNPPSIRPGGTADLQVIATFTPASADIGGVHTLTGLTSGTVSATFAADTPAEVGFVQTGSDTLAHSAQDIVEDSDCSMSSNRLICTFVFNQALRANVLGSFDIEVTSGFSITPLVNGITVNAGTPTSADLLDATLRVRRPSPSNRPPVARGSIDDLSLIESGEPQPIDVQDKFRDPNRDRLTYTASSSDESIATVSVDGSMVTVTPVGAGTATITVTAEDRRRGRARQRFDVTVERAGPPVTPVPPVPPVTPEGPVAEGAIGAQSTTEGGATVTINVAGNFSDPNGDELTYTASSSDESVATVIVNGSMVTVTTMGAGTVTITVTARDPGGEVAIQRFTVTAQRVNLAPVPEGSINAQRSTEGGAAVAINVAGSFSDANGDELTYTAMSSDESVASVSVDGSMVTVPPVGAGTATITVTARDPGGEAATQRFTVAAEEANLAPVPEGSINVQRLTEGGDAVTINVASNFSDANGDELTYTASSSDESVATVSVDGSMVTVTPVGAGTATITVIARDPGGKAAFQRFTVTAEEANLSPAPEGSINGQSMTEGGGGVTIDVAGNFSDANGDELAYTADSSDESVATVSVDGSMVTVTPVGAGTATITVTVQDPGDASAQQNFSADVEASNEAPQAAGTIAADDLVEGGEPARLDVSGNFTDPNGDSLTFEAQSSDESVATVSMDGSTVTVTPVGAGTARITVTASDSDVAGATQSFTVTVDPPPTPPTPPTPATATPAPPATATPAPPATATPDSHRRRQPRRRRRRQPRRRLRW